MTILLILIHILACLTLILVVLLQGGSEAGLSGAFGGGSASESAFGAQSNKFLTKFTTVMAIIFMISSISLALIAAKKNRSIVANEKIIATEPTEPIEPTEPKKL